LLAIYSTSDEKNSFCNNAKKKTKKSYKAFNSFMAKTIWKKNDLEGDTCTKIFDKRLPNNIYIDLFYLSRSTLLFRHIFNPCKYVWYVLYEFLIRIGHWSKECWNKEKNNFFLDTYQKCLYSIDYKHFKLNIVAAICFLLRNT
jgi:hypothetical protein